MSVTAERPSDIHCQHRFCFPEIGVERHAQEIPWKDAKSMYIARKEDDGSSYGDTH